MGGVERWPAEVVAIAIFTVDTGAPLVHKARMKRLGKQPAPTTFVLKGGRERLPCVPYLF
jgi:hypothetical protein